MANTNGNPSALVPAPHGNQRARKHGAYSLVGLSERETEIVGELERLPWARPIDAPVLREIARLTALSERLDAALSDGRVENRKGQVRTLVDQRRRLSAHLLKLYEAVGATPAARASWAAALAHRAKLSALLDGEDDG